MYEYFGQDPSVLLVQHLWYQRSWRVVTVKQGYVTPCCKQGFDKVQLRGHDLQVGQTRSAAW